MNTRRQPEISGTKEWAICNENLQSGCEHGCRLCYAFGNAVRFHRETPATWLEPKICLHKVSKSFGKRKGRIMFPSSHDITPLNLQVCIRFLRNMLKPCNQVLIVSKPHADCIEKLCEELWEYKCQILFRFTIGSSSDEVLKFWEPNAPSFMERLDSLIYAYEQSFQTSVSCEPMLDDNIDQVVVTVQPFVTDCIWLGKANRLRQIISLTCPGDAEVKKKADELIEMQNDSNIRTLYCRYKDNPMIKWKDSIKKVVGLDMPKEPGLDI